MSYSIPKLAVKDSFDDDDASDDVEDEVFIRDGRNGFKVDEERGVKRPLMAPRRKFKNGNQQIEIGKYSSCKVLCVPCCYGVIALTTLLGLILLIVFFIVWFPFPLDQVAFWRLSSSDQSSGIVTSCTEIEVTDVWKKKFPKFVSESALQLNDINNDGIDDIIVGYGTGVDGHSDPKFVCTVYFNGAEPCFGGLLALDGLTGNVLWQHWAPHTIFRVDCNADITSDNINDCLCTGKGGVFEIINGHDGSIVWHTQPHTLSSDTLMNIYTSRFIQDIDGDGIQDILAMHTEEAVDTTGATTLRGHIILVGGRHGKLLQSVDTPKGEESYYAPQILVRPDGENVILFGTGGRSSPGGLYAVPLHELIVGDIQNVKVLYRDEFKGIMSPAVLADINHDDTEDIIVAAFNSNVLAFDGHLLNLIWNYTIPNSETFSMPTPGYFNDDDVPDFLVKYQIGPGFPLYYYSQTLILDGKTGTPLLDKDLLTDTAGTQTAGLSISIEGTGNDIFLHWSANCLGHEKAQDIYAFMPDTPLQDQSKADLCKLRFNATFISKLLALSQHVQPPGVVVYSSDEYKAFEYNNSINASAEAQNYIDKHPDFWEMYGRQKILGRTSTETNNDGEEMINSDSSFSQKDGLKDTPDSSQNETPQDHYPSGPYPLMNRGRNRQSGNKLSVGEDEETIPAYNSNSDYPDVRKHGVGHGKHHKTSSDWRRQWQHSHLAPQNNNIINKHLISGYQNIDPANIVDTPITNRDSDYDLLYPSGDDSLVLQQGQRDERDTKQQKFNGNIVFPAANDIQGIQRVTSAGVLATPTVIASETNSIDIVFTTHWIYPTPNIRLLSAKELTCIEKKLQDSGNLATGEERLDMSVVKDCYDSQPSEKKYDTSTQFSNMGQMTVYRLRLSCTCSSTGVAGRCSRVLPLYKQSWPSAEGSLNNGFFRPRKNV